MILEPEDRSANEARRKRMRRWIWSVVLAVGLIAFALPFAGQIAYAISVYFVNHEPMWKGPKGDLEHDVDAGREVRAGEASDANRTD